MDTDFPLSDEGFKIELSSWIVFHITSVFIALIQCPVMFLDLCISCCVFSVNTLLDSSYPHSVLMSCEQESLGWIACVELCLSETSLSVFYLFFPLREESWWGSSEAEPYVCWKSSVVGSSCFLTLCTLCSFNKVFPAAISKTNLIWPYQRCLKMQFDGMWVAVI